MDTKGSGGAVRHRRGRLDTRSNGRAQASPCTRSGAISCPGVSERRVSLGRTKISPVRAGRPLSAFAGLAVVATQTQGDPLPGGYTLTSVAAVVLGGVSLALGGRGGVLGPILAVMILSQIKTEPDVPERELQPGHRGPRRLISDCGRDARQHRAASVGRGAWTAAQQTAKLEWRNLALPGGVARPGPLLPLLALLALLVLTFALLNPRADLQDWVAATLRAAIPLAIPRPRRRRSRCSLVVSIYLWPRPRRMAGFRGRVAVYRPWDSGWGCGRPDLRGGDRGHQRNWRWASSAFTR